MAPMTNRPTLLLRPVLRGFAIAATAAFALSATGCKLENEALNKDLASIKGLLEEQKKDLESTRRKLEFRLDTLEEKVETRTDTLKNNLADQEQKTREQADAMDKLRRQVDELAYRSGGGSTSSPSAPPTDAASTPAAAAPAPPPAEAAYDRGAKQFALGNYDAARKEFEAALAASPDARLAVKTKYILGESLFALEDWAPAQANYKEVIRADASDPLAWQSLERLAQISVRQGRTDVAISFYKQIIDVNPGYEGIERVKEQVRVLGGTN